MVGDLLRNIFTGYYEEPRPTSEARTQTRQENIINECESLLKRLVGPGDLLDSATRAEFAKEAWGAVNSCDGCKELPCLRDPNQFVNFNRDNVSHQYHSESPFRDIAHAIVNNQDKLNEVLFDTFVQRIQEHVNKDVAEDGDIKTKDDCTAMAVEFCIIAACCAGIHDFYVGAGIELPSRPSSDGPSKPAIYSHVSDYAESPLQFDKSTAWGPYLTEFKPSIVKENDFDPFLHKFRGHSNGPTSKSSAVPVTSYHWMHFMTVTYFETDNLGFFGVPGKDRHLNRAQIEVVSAAYNNAKHCGF